MASLDPRPSTWRRYVPRRGTILGAAPWVLIAGLLVGWLVRAALKASGGVLAAPLDDTYIHFVYARSIATGHPFHYHAGDPASSGASSPVYAVLLAVAWLFGARQSALYVAALVFGVAALAAAAALAARVATRLAGGDRRVRLPAAACVLGWGWLCWHAASGMETVLACAVALGTWEAALGWAEAWPAARSPRRAAALVALAWVLPLVRPTFAALTLAVAIALLVAPAQGRARARLLALPAAFGAVSHELFWWLVTGRAESNGAAAKLLLAHPWLTHQEVVDQIRDRAKLLLHFLFGTTTDRPYLPPFVAGIAIGIGLLWIVLGRPTARRLTAAALGLGTAAALLGLTTFLTFDGHRFRYLFPLVVPLLVLGVAALSRLGARIDARRGTRAVGLALFLPALLAGAMITTWQGVTEDFARASSEVFTQHLHMAARVRELPRGARIGVTDAGVIAYLGGHPTTDLVGLTTNGASRYYIAGPGSQYEYIDSLPPSKRPAYFITYTTRNWWFPMTLVGPMIAHFSLPAPPTIVGARTLALWPARYDELGRDDRPAIAHVQGRLLDAIDVCDIDDEHAHDYRIVDGGDPRADSIIRTYVIPGRGPLGEGGRVVRTAERFRIAGRPGRPLGLVLRTDVWFDADLVFDVNGAHAGTLHVARAGRWAEVRFDVPARFVRAVNDVEVRRRGRDVASFHWWAYALGGLDGAARAPAPSP